MPPEATNEMDFLNLPLTRTAWDIAEGNYAGVLAAFGKPFELKDNFAKEGDPDKKVVFEAVFVILTKDGAQTVDYLLPLPQGGMANRKSNVYKMLKSLRGADPKFFQPDGNFSKDVTLTGFIGSPAMVQVKKNAKDFPAVEAVASPVEGVKLPAAKDISAALNARSASSNDK